MNDYREDFDEDSTKALKGITISGFPNLYLMLGPNTGLGYNFLVFMIEW